MNNWNTYQVGNTSDNKKGNTLPTHHQHATNNKQELKKDKNDKEVKNIYGEFENVRLSDVEYKKLLERLPQEAVDGLIEQLDGYIESKGKQYKSHYATILNWARKRIQDHSAQISARPVTKRQMV